MMTSLLFPLMASPWEITSTMPHPSFNSPPTFPTLAIATPQIPCSWAPGTSGDRRWQLVGRPKAVKLHYRKQVRTRAHHTRKWQAFSAMMDGSRQEVRRRAYPTFFSESKQRLQGMAQCIPDMSVEMMDEDPIRRRIQDPGRHRQRLQVI